MLEFDGVVKRFGPVAALDECTFAARPGRLTGFLGPNGGGKTTAMRAVFGLVELDAGTVCWRGETRRRCRAGQVRVYARGARFVPEDAGAGSAGVSRAVVRTDDEDVGRIVDNWLSRLGLAARVNHSVDSLSHGNQQRVQLIAALVNEPELLVLDEPFSGLDPIAIGVMAELLAELAASGATVLFSSHQLDLVEDLCEDVVIIDHGHIVLAGALADLRAAVPQRFVDIRYGGPPPDWSKLATVEVLETKDGHVRLRLDHDSDLTAIVAAATSIGEPISFDYQPPSLTELFRQAVAT